MEIRVPYGHKTLSATLPGSMSADLIAPARVPGAADPLALVRQALGNPAGGVRLGQFTGVKSAAIAVNDKTRPVPHQYLLPPLLEELERLGLEPGQIKLIVAVGTHPPMTPDEFPSILPKEILDRYPVMSHDGKDESLLVSRGQTSRGTRVLVNRFYAEADLRLAVGNIEPHQFAGFSGGVKSAAIGLAGAETINHNHSMLSHPDSRIGEYETNPARQDVEEIGQRIGIGFVVNAILNGKKQVVHALAGEPRAVMQAGIPLSRQVCQVAVPQPYDLIIVSPGGHPKDINVYQSQKGLAHAALITRPRGTIILAAACPEGTGSQTYETWMRGKHSYEQVLGRFSEEGFHIGAHKAYQIARDAVRFRLLSVTDMEPDFARFLLLNPVRGLQEAVDLAVADLGPGCRIGVMPAASSTIPYVRV